MTEKGVILIYMTFEHTPSYPLVNVLVSDSKEQVLEKNKSKGGRFSFPPSLNTILYLEKD